MAPCIRLVESIARPTVTFKTEYVKEITKALIKGIRILLTCEGYKKRTESERKSIDHIVDLLSPLDDDDAVKAIKYLTAVYLPRLVGDVEPERPGFLTETSTLFAFEYQRFIKRLLSPRGGEDSVRHRPKVSNRALKLAFSILQLKRYLPPLPKTLRTKALKGLKKRLTTPGSSPNHMLEQLKRTANELFPPGWDFSIPVPGYTVTNKSCFEQTRGAGGSQSYMFSSEWPGSPCTKDDGVTPLTRSATDQLIDFSTHHTLDGLSVREEKKDRETPRHDNAVGKKEYERVALATVPEILKAKAEIVEDPLKARIITKNNWQCTILKPLQKMIHGRLRQHPAFQLIGSPLSAEIINEHLPQPPNTKWVSGDYEAATDNLHSDATQTVLNVILDNMTGRKTEQVGFIDLARRSLTGLTIYHEELGEFIMERGQLMGSLLSFPILCIINFSVWRHALEMSTRESSNGVGMGGPLDHVLINGDDIGFAATEKQFELWKKMVPLVGLKPSAGKNYFCDEFLSLNSELYTRNPETGLMRRIHFTNLGLLVNPEDDTTILKLESLGQMHDDFLKGVEYKGAGSSIFIDSHKSLLKMSIRNLFGPRGHGGLGATPVHGSKGSGLEGYNVRQLVIAHLLESEKVRLPSVSPVARYNSFQRAYLRRAFPDVEEYREDKLPDPIKGFEWENVTSYVEEAAISHRAMTSWLAPEIACERPTWDFWNKCKKEMDRGRGAWKELHAMTVDDYLKPVAERAIYRLIPFGLSEFAEDVVDLFGELS